MSARTILLIGSEAVSSIRPACFDSAMPGEEVLRVSEMDEALRYLRGSDRSASRESNPAPGLVMVWSSVGKAAISSLLSCVRSEKRLAHTPIVVLTDLAETLNDNVESASRPCRVDIGDTDRLLEIVSTHFHHTASQSFPTHG